jgi:phosphoglycerate dehydrogenase-like enzyme
MRLVIHIHTLPMWSLPQAQVERIQQALPGVDVVDVRDDARVGELIGGADVALATRMTEATLAAASTLRWVHSTAVGVGALPLDALAARGIPVTNTRGVHAEMIAEHALAMLLGLRRQFPAAVAHRQARTWGQHEMSTVPMPRLAATTVLVLGLGAIGACFAAFASALGMTVIGIRRDLSRAQVPGVARVEPLTALRDLLPIADAVVVALPHTAETHHVLGPAELALMKPSAMVINIARGTLIDESALADALVAGRLGGAGLDVFTREPLAADSPLWTTPRTILTPHTSAFDGDYWTPAVDVFLANWHRFVAGEPLENLVDPTRGY